MKVLSYLVLCVVTATCSARRRSLVNLNAPDAKCTVKDIIGRYQPLYHAVYEPVHLNPGERYKDFLLSCPLPAKLHVVACDINVVPGVEADLDIQVVRVSRLQPQLEGYARVDMEEYCQVPFSSSLKVV